MRYYTIILLFAFSSIYSQNYSYNYTTENKTPIYVQLSNYEGETLMCVLNLNNKTSETKSHNLYTNYNGNLQFYISKNFNKLLSTNIVKNNAISFSYKSDIKQNMTISLNNNNLEKLNIILTDNQTGIRTLINKYDYNFTNTVSDA